MQSFHKYSTVVTADKWHSVMLATVMHMSSACPRGRPPGWRGGYVREFKGMEWVLCPWAGGNSRDCFRINELGWGNLQHCWIMVSNTWISREHLPPARREKTQIAHGLLFQLFRPAVLRYVSLTVSYCSRLESYLFICKLRAWFVSRLTIYEQGAFGKLADTSRNHKTRLWLTVKRLKMFIWLLYNWIVHSIMKFGDFVIFQSRAWFFTALSLGLGFSNKGLGESRILPFAN